MKGFTNYLAAVLITCAGAQTAVAQVITDGEIDRGLRYRNTTPWDGLNYTQRYNYYTGPYIYLNGSSAQLQYLDYLDRADRAKKFGYPMPADPFFPEPILPPEANVPETTVAQPIHRGFLFRRFR